MSKNWAPAVVGNDGGEGKKKKCWRQPQSEGDKDVMLLSLIKADAIPTEAGEVRGVVVCSWKEGISKVGGEDDKGYQTFPHHTSYPGAYRGWACLGKD